MLATFLGLKPLWRNQMRRLPQTERLPFAMYWGHRLSDITPNYGESTGQE